MKKFISLSLIVSIGLFAQSLKIDDLIKKAMLNSPDIKISEAQYKRSKEQTKQADGDYLPQINFTAEAGKQGVDYKDQKVNVGAGQPPIELGKIDTNILIGGVTAKQLIYDFGKTTGNINKFTNTEKALKKSLQQTISDKVYTVKKAYYNLLAQYALIEVSKENVKLNEKQLYRSKRYFEAGIRTKVDVTDAQVNLTKAKLSLNNAMYDTKLALVTLNNEIGHNSDNTRLDIYIDTPDLEKAYDSLPKLSQNEIYYRQEAYNNRADLEQYTELLNATKSKYKQVTGDYYPSVYANGQYIMQDVDEDAFVPEEQWKASVSVEWNLFSGNKTQALEEETRIDILKAQADLNKIKLEIQKKVSNSFISVNKELDSTKLSQSLSFSSKEKFIQVQKRYEYGLADFIELQEARQTYIDSIANLARSYYRYYTALAKLDNAIGK